MDCFLGAQAPTANFSPKAPRPVVSSPVVSSPLVSSQGAKWALLRCEGIAQRLAQSLCRFVGVDPEKNGCLAVRVRAIKSEGQQAPRQYLWLLGRRTGSERGVREALPCTSGRGRGCRGPEDFENSRRRRGRTSRHRQGERVHRCAISIVENSGRRDVSGSEALEQGVVVVHFAHQASCRGRFRWALDPPMAAEARTTSEKRACRTMRATNFLGATAMGCPRLTRGHRGPGRQDRAMRGSVSEARQQAAHPNGCPICVPVRCQSQHRQVRGSHG